MPIAFDQLGPILHPMTPGGYHGNAMLHVPGTPDKFANLMSWSRLNALLDMDVWSAATLNMVLDRQSVPPETSRGRPSSPVSDDSL
jgi:hypothetical protein